MWVITFSINDYSQYGDYFHCAFNSKPTLEDLRKVFPESNIDFLNHISNGGGRTEQMEGTWYFLTEIKSGEIYEHS